MPNSLEWNWELGWYSAGVVRVAKMFTKDEHTIVVYGANSFDNW